MRIDWFDTILKTLHPVLQIVFSQVATPFVRITISDEHEVEINHETVAK